ncbi:unnamed protein product [Nezara viridula]|uniref:Histone H2A n=1 Tax=Nezara viridula TaxID=85310 RepID=A0A9P0E4J0_NEZVI|nr:unnamed protein product [Nezara viridula]
MSDRKSTSVKRKNVTRSLRCGLTFPVGRIHRHLKHGWYAKRIRNKAAIFLTAVLEYLVTEVVTMGGNMARASQNKRVMPKHLLLGLMNDEELKKLVAELYNPKMSTKPEIKIKTEK